MTRWGRILRNLGMILPVIVLTLLIVTAIFADVLAPYPYDETSLPERRMPPAWVEGGSSKHFLGTDTLGRDILSRAIYGARVSLSVSLLAIAITAIIGTALGIFSAYMGGRIDAFVMRVVDVALSFPPLLLAILIAVSLGPGYFTVVFAL